MARSSMSNRSGIGDQGDLGAMASVERLSIEDLSEIRYIHAAAFRLVAGPFFSEAVISSFIGVITSQAYADGMMAAMRDNRLIGARIGRELVGTVGWSYGEDHGETARLQWLFVRPLFTDCGIGRRLVHEIETLAITAGFRQMSVRSTATAVGFFERIGYHTTSHGVRTLGPGLNLPVTFMRRALTLPEAGNFTKH